MFVIRRIHRRYGDNICRRCINRLYRVRLEPPDCQYGYIYKCPVCKEPHHIVVSLTPSGRLKTLFR